jgi:hypothetical protein
MPEFMPHQDAALKAVAGSLKANQRMRERCGSTIRAARLAAAQEAR